MYPAKDHWGNVWVIVINCFAESSFRLQYLDFYLFRHRSLHWSPVFKDKNLPWSIFSQWILFLLSQDVLQIFSFSRYCTKTSSYLKLMDSVLNVSYVTVFCLLLYNICHYYVLMFQQFTFLKYIFRNGLSITILYWTNCIWNYLVHGYSITRLPMYYD